MSDVGQELSKSYLRVVIFNVKMMENTVEKLSGNQAICWLIAVALALEKQSSKPKSVNRTEKRIEKFKDADECFAYLESIGAFDKQKSSINID